MRGNHSDPACFESSKLDFERMKCIPDYSVVRVMGRNVLCVGGAISVDRQAHLETMMLNKRWRLPVRPLYWKNELPVFDEKALSEFAANGIAIDYVVPHTCPSFCYPHSKRGIEEWLVRDVCLAADLLAERAVMNKLYERLLTDKHSLKEWYYAHSTNCTRSLSAA